MEKNTRLDEFLVYLNSLKILNFLRPKVDEKGRTVGYELKYRLCGFRGTSENGIVYCLAAETFGFVGTGIIEKKCEFCKPFDHLELRCNQDNYL